MHWMEGATEKQLHDVIQAVKKIDGNYKRMKDETIVKKLLDDEINLYQILFNLDEQFPAICMAAVKQWGSALEYVKKQTPEICMAAVQQDGWALRYVEEQTPAIYMTAVQQNSYALQYVKEQTPEICMAAVQQDGFALQFVKEQTPEICMAAVQQEGYALRYALRYVKDPKLRKELESCTG